MFHTPKNMVNTRRTAKKDEEQMEVQSSVQKVPALPINEEKPINEDILRRDKTFLLKSKPEGSVVKSEPPLTAIQMMPSTSQQVPKARSQRSSSSSVMARKKRLELEAAEAKARIELDLIEKRLAANLAEIDDECSVQSDHTNKEVEEWLERSHRELEAEPVRDRGQMKDVHCSPAAQNAGTNDGTVHLLASALRDIAAASTSNNFNTNFLSRICTPKDLPLFSGDPMEWLHFKQAYEESSKVCNFKDNENLWRLRKCLKGPAREAVSALLISATSPETVMSTLELQFGNPDVILSRILLDIKKLQPVSQEYHKDIVPFSIKVRNCVAAVKVIGQDEYLNGISITTSILSKLPPILISKWADYSYAWTKQGKRPTWFDISEFLNQEATKVSSIALLNKKKYTEGTVLLNKIIDNSEKCPYCRITKHKLHECKKFRKALRKDRWSFVKRNRLCYKCIDAKHDRATCPAAACDVDNCGQAHHKLLHYNSRETVNSDGQLCVSNNPDLTVPESGTIAHIKSSECKVLLKVVPVRIHGPNGIFTTSALLDDGSTISLISASLAARAGLRGRRESLHVRGAWDDSSLVCDTDVISVCIANYNGEKFNISVRSMQNFSLPMQNYNVINFNNYSHLCNMKDKFVYSNTEPEILIGQDNYKLLLPLDIKIGKCNEPCATRTPLGWCVHGLVPKSLSTRAYHSALHVTTVQLGLADTSLEDLHEMVRKSFTIESMGISGKPRQNSDDLRALEHLEQTAKLIDGRWHVGIPWKDANSAMPDSECTALSRLHNLEKKMASNNQYAQRYRERIKHLLDNDFATEILDTRKTTKTWYLPHFGVDNPNKSKLRLVFDAAAKTRGLSLNDYILTGPDLLMSILGIMLRFREHEVAVVADIKDMFLRVKILQADQDAFRFLWRDNSNEPVKTYKMTSLIFGANCAPFIAQFIKNKNAEKYESSKPLAVQAIREQHYMDDYIDSQPNDQICHSLARDIINIHRQGGFEIRNWLSNSAEVLNNLPKDLLAPTASTVKIGARHEGERALGIIWYPDNDTLGFVTSFKRISKEIIDGVKTPTKRELLKVIMSLFDVHGFLAPFTINGKILLQETWKSNIGWDEHVTDETCRKWFKWLKLLKLINNIRIQRCYKRVNASALCNNVAGRDNRYDSQLISASLNDLPTQTPVSNETGYNCLQLHIFCDASTQAMCAVAYWRWLDNNKQIHVCFVASKCRVAPVKPVTVPRLELQAAIIAARLANTLQSAHRIKPANKFFWCDSTTVLQWIRNSSRSYKPYVAHRLGEIDELTQVKEWRYVPTSWNVADKATRENFDVLQLNDEWFNGPSFLYESESSWPMSTVIPSDAELDIDKEVVTNIVHCNYLHEHAAVPDPKRFSSWIRLLRATAAVLKFINKCRRKEIDDCTRMKHAETLLLHYSQQKSFRDDIKSIKGGKCIEKNSRLRTLTPFLDEQDILRVGGRIDAAADVSFEVKHPAILDGKCQLAKLIAKYYHEKAGHANQEMVVNNLKQKFWLIKLRPTVKEITSRCMLCRLRKAKPQMPKMGDLPAARVAHHQRPFTHCGVDLFGPIEVTIGRRREKRYGVLFTCLTVRAIHLETVSSLSTDSLIMALRRMASRRGWPAHLYSDNGTNLRGACTELKKAAAELDETLLQTAASTQGTRWTFIPPASPHWGGAWERLIRSVKVALKVVLNERAPREEVLNTLLAEVEVMVNGRPLSHVSVDANSKESLTPNHFLLGSSSNSPQMGSFDDSDLFRRRQWRIAQRLADMFWRRWVTEVLPEMIPRKRWTQDESKPIQLGDLVFIVDPNAPRNVWPRGVIESVFPGRDGRVRVVQVRTQVGTVKRSVARVARIPVDI